MKSLFHFLQSRVCPCDLIVLQKHSKAFSVLYHTMLMNLSLSLHDSDPTLHANFMLETTTNPHATKILIFSSLSILIIVWSCKVWSYKRLFNILPTSGESQHLKWEQKISSHDCALVWCAEVCTVARVCGKGLVKPRGWMCVHVRVLWSLSEGFHIQHAVRRTFPENHTLPLTLYCLL